jgi:Asp-tRNA(Asn)/Glu-tRNA(Gln) amidotransferase A subunit family amidase
VRGVTRRTHSRDRSAETNSSHAGSQGGSDDTQTHVRKQIELTLDHTGPIARTAADVALLLEVLAGPDGLDPRQPAELRTEAYTNQLTGDARGLRIGIVTEGFGWPNSEPDSDGMVREAAQRLSRAGATVSEVSIPLHRDGVHVWNAIAVEGATMLMVAGGSGVPSCSDLGEGHRDGARRATSKTVSKSRSLVACSTWMCSPTVRAAASRSLDRVLARVGLLGLTSRAMTVEHYRYLAAETERKNVVRALSGARVS